MGKLATRIPVPSRREVLKRVRAFLDVDSVHERDVVNLLDIREALGIRRHPAVGAVDWAKAMGIRIHATRRPKYGPGTEVLVRLGEFADELQTSPKLRNSYRLSASKVGEPFPGTNYHDMLREGTIKPHPRGGPQTVEINPPCAGHAGDSCRPQAGLLTSVRPGVARPHPADPRPGHSAHPIGPRRESGGAACRATRPPAGRNRGIVARTVQSVGREALDLGRRARRPHAGRGARR